MQLSDASTGCGNGARHLRRLDLLPLEWAEVIQRLMQTGAEAA
jgi:hypothetical protein